MIQANELRIGNLVLGASRGEFLIVSGNLIEQIERGIVVVGPIQLTEEWLLKFGYSSSFSTDPQNFPASKQFDLKGFKIHQPIEDVEQFIFDPLVNDYIELKSVHQLQNLYFALTGEELKLNDK